MYQQDNATHFYVQNILKTYPTKQKLIKYKKGFMKTRPGVHPRDLWLDPIQYDQHIEYKRALNKNKPVLVQYQPVMQLALPFDATYKRFLEALDVQPILDTSLSNIDAHSSLERSMRRSKLHIKDIIDCNDFDLFLTFSFATDRYNLDKSRHRMTQWLKDQKKIHGQFGYIIIPEFHKDKKAIHFHALFNNYKGNLQPAINPKTNKPLLQKGKQVFNVTSWRNGFSNATYIVNKAKTSNYVTKYVTKDLSQIKGKKRYWYSRDLKKPEVTYNENIDERYFTEIYQHDNFTILLDNDTIEKQNNKGV